MLKFNYQYALTEKDIQKEEKRALSAYDTLVNKSGLGNDFLGWLDYPKHPFLEEIERIKKAAATIQKTSEILVVVGIGGSVI